MHIKLTLILLFTSLANTIFTRGAEPDSIRYMNTVFDQRIRTVQLYREGWNLSYPVMRLNSNEKLELHFDLLGNQPETFYYTFIHCDKDWNKSDIFVNDYIDGFPENQIEDLKSSFNTTVGYYHYKLTFPNDRVTIRYSGNYILYVYPAGNQERPSLTQRFVITEDAAGIKATAHRPQMTSVANEGQQVDFDVSFNGINVIDPYRTIFSFVLQNGNWNSAKKNLKPDFYGNNELKYNSLSEKNIFKGGNEYRYFDIRSIRYLSEYIRRIDFSAPNYNVFLTSSENRGSKPYFYRQDFNGKFYIAVQEGRNNDTDADYLNVYFTLPSFYPVENGSVHVSGALSGWSFGDHNRMIYNFEKQQYECTMLLKQGWYNYEYVYLKKGESRGSASTFEGDHYETENDYLILVYYRNPRERYDRLIGSATINTLNRIAY
jgi:hypothetical protein